jgi:hypothetical protein
MRKVMDRETAEHFYAWLETVGYSEQSEVEDAIHKLLRIYPELIETHSWPEMRRMAEVMAA